MAFFAEDVHLLARYLITIQLLLFCFEVVFEYVNMLMYFPFWAVQALMDAFSYGILLKDQMRKKSLKFWVRL